MCVRLALATALLLFALTVTGVGASAVIRPGGYVILTPSGGRVGVEDALNVAQLVVDSVKAWFEDAYIGDYTLDFGLDVQGGNVTITGIYEDRVTLTVEASSGEWSHTKF